MPPMTTSTAEAKLQRTESKKTTKAKLQGRVIKKTAKAKLQGREGKKKTRRGGSSDWASLPDVVLEIIHKLFSLPEHYIFGAVCKSWRRVAADAQYPPAATTTLGRGEDGREPVLIGVHSYPTPLLLVSGQGVLIPITPRGGEGRHVRHLPRLAPHLPQRPPQKDLPLQPFLRCHHLTLACGPATEVTRHASPSRSPLLHSRPNCAIVCLTEKGHVYVRWVHQIARPTAWVTSHGEFYSDVASYDGAIFLVTIPGCQLVGVDLAVDPPRERLVVLDGALRPLPFSTIPTHMFLGVWGSDLVMLATHWELGSYGARMERFEA